MKMLFDSLKKELLQARIAKNQFKIDLISYLIGECSRNEKSPSDDVVIKKLKAYKTSVAQMSDDKTKQEVEYIDSFLPVKQEMSEDELRQICLTLKDNGQNTIKDVMVYFKQNHSGQYDGNVLRQVFQNLEK